MIQKLRRKFILVNMVLVILVLMGVFGVQLASTYRGLSAQSTMALTMALKAHGGVLPRPEIGGGDYRPDHQKDAQLRPFSLIPTFSVELDSQGAVIAVSADAVDVSDQVVAQAAAQAAAKHQTAGTLPGLDLRFLKEETPQGTLRLAFADRSQEWDSIQRLLLVSMAVGGGALVIFFLISLFLSHLALRPAAQAWQQQRQFVADASHELKTPLTVILANTGIVLAHPQDTIAQQKRWLEDIGAEGVRMKGLVEDLLFLAKSDEGRRGGILPTTLSLSDLVTEVLLAFESVAFEQGVTLTEDIAPALTTQGDPLQLRRLVMLLLDNACKYAGSPGTVKLTLARLQDKARLTIHNTGTPIPPQALEHIFQRFYRVDDARTRVQGGYGLGLAIAKAITEDCGGKISATSLPQEGTTFTVLLPLA